MTYRLLGFALAIWASCALADDPREAAAARIMDATSLDRVILANARAQAMADPAYEQRFDEWLYQLRKPALWSSSHPAWKPAREALREMAARESGQWVGEYWRTQARAIHVRELAFTFKPDYVASVREFAESEAGKAWFARRLALARAGSGEAMFSLDPATPAQLERLAAEARRRVEALLAAEKQRVKAFEEGDARWLETYVKRQSEWIAQVLLGHMGDVHYRTRDAWRAELDARFAAQLPVDSRKQLLGTLEMRREGTIVLRLDGSNLALEFSRSHPRHDEMLALAPGLVPGRSRVIYRDRDGTIGDKP